MRLSCGIVAGALQLRTEAAAPDELRRNRWIVCSGISGRIQSEWVDDLPRNREVRTFFWTCLCRQAYALPVGFGAHASERHLDTFFVIPPEITVKLINELGYGDSFP